MYENIMMKFLAQLIYANKKRIRHLLYYIKEYKNGIRQK
jgi:hypothetical protein